MLEEFHLSGVCVFYFDERGGARTARLRGYSGVYKLERERRR